MRIHLNTRRLPALLWLMVCWGAAALTAAPVPPPEKLLPASTLAVVTVPDQARARAAAELNPGWRLLGDPAMKPIVDKFLAKWRSDVVSRLEQQFGVKFADYAGLAQGQITLAWLLAPPSQGSEDPRLSSLLLLDSGTNAPLLKKSLDDLRKKWVDSGHQLKVDKIRGVEFTTLILSAGEIEKTFDKLFPPKKDEVEEKGRRKDRKEPPAKLEWLVGQSDSLLVLGNSASDIEKVLALQSGSGGSPLAEAPNFAADSQGLFRDAGLYGWANVQETVKLVKKTLASTEGGRRRPADGAPDPSQIIDGLGFAGLRSVAYAVHATPDGTSYDVRVSIPESERRGLVRMLSFSAKDAAPPPFVPADVMNFSRWRIDMFKSFETLESTVTQIFPPSASIIKMFMDTAGKEKDPNFDLRKNLFANLGDDVISYSRLPREKTLAALNDPPGVLLIGSRDAEQLASAVKTLSAFLPAQAARKDREFRGKKVFTVTLPGSPRAISMASSGGYLVVSDDDAMLEEFLRSNEQNAKPLRDVEGLKEAADRIRGMGTGLFGYLDGVESARVQFEALRKDSGSVANLVGALPLGARLGFDEDSKAFKEWVDFSLLPPFDKVVQYFNHMVWSGVFTADAFELRFFEPTPPRLRK
jgi:hypothetical protein